jgi:hypothetical protein
MEGIQFSSGNWRFGRYLRNAGRKEGVDIRLVRLYNVVTNQCKNISHISERQFEILLPFLEMHSTHSKFSISETM